MPDPTRRNQRSLNDGPGCRPAFHERVLRRIGSRRPRAREIVKPTRTSARKVQATAVRSLTLWEDYSREEVHGIFAPGTRFTGQAGTWGLQGIVQVPHRSGDFVFFVTFGKREPNHIFDEWITDEGALSWQSQPKQTLRDTQIGQLIGHDELRNTIYLFLRTRAGMAYTYLGRLAYITHDRERERPVHFQWQLLDWPPPPELLLRIGLRLVSGAPLEPKESPTSGIWEVSEAPIRHPRTGTKTRDFQPKKGNPGAGAAQKYGLPGEELVVQYERGRLTAAGRSDLGARVRHVAKEEGDGAGYDVLSYDGAGMELYIEVKTTTGAKDSMFFITSNELAFADKYPEQYLIYRIYNYDPGQGRAKLFVLKGSPRDHVLLSPTQYRASWTE
jgi:hypothetical protein